MQIAVVLSELTFLALILCQYTGQDTGATSYYVARTVAVMLGLSLPVLVCNAILPWYTSEWALEKLSGAYLESIRVARLCYDKHYVELQSASMGGQQHQQPPPAAPAQQPLESDGSASRRRTPAAAGPESFGDIDSPSGPAKVPSVLTRLTSGIPAPTPAPGPIHSRIAAPLVAVQISLKSDTVAWQRGVLATPPIVPALLQSMLILLDRIAALALTLRPPSVTGSFSGGAFRHLLHPVDEDIRGVRWV